MKPIVEKQVLYVGSERAPVPEAILRAGPIEVLFRDGVFRYIRLGKREILRAVYFAVRDRDWRTINGEMSNLEIRAGAESFEVTYDCAHRGHDIDFRWNARVSGHADGRVVWNAQGEAFASFSKNRIGYCVLHPIAESVGASCEITHSDGTLELTRFPIAVAPHQPFLDVAAMRIFLDQALDVELAFAGDQFETEDQRNWTDASFKTYSTPLARPYPARVDKGTIVTQSVSLKLRGKIAEESRPSPDAEVRLTVLPDLRTRLPYIGLKCAASSERLSEKAILRLRELRLDHLGVDLIPGDGSSEEEFWIAAAMARRLDLPLEVALAAFEEFEPLKRILLRIANESVSICRWLVDLQMQQPARQPQLEALKAIAPVVVGTSGNFAELNRNRPSMPPEDGVCFSLNPQVHACDDATLIENLAAQSSAIGSLRDWVESAPIVVSPVTLKPRMAHLNRLNDPGLDIHTLHDDVDPRQSSLLGAGWTLGSLKHLAESGVASATYYETAGSKGVLASQTDLRLGGLFHLIPGAVFPVYHVFRDVLDLKGAEVLRTESSDPLRVDGMALVQEARLRVFVANFQATKVSVALQLGGLAQSCASRQMDENNVEECMADPESRGRTRPLKLFKSEGSIHIELEPYALATIDALADSAYARNAGGLRAGGQ